MVKKISKSYLTLFLIFSLAIAFSFSNVSADDIEELENLEVELMEPGLTPDSPFYGFKNFGQWVKLSFAFDKSKKAEIKADFAEEKLAEFRLMIEENKPQEARKAKEKYDRFVLEVEKESEELDDESRMKIKRRIILNKFKATELADELDFKIRSKSETNRDQLNVIIDDLSEENSDFGEEENEVNDLICDKALNRVEEARVVLVEGEEFFVEDDKFQQRLNQAKEHFEESQIALEENKCGRAFGLSTSTINIIKHLHRDSEDDTGSKQRLSIHILKNTESELSRVDFRLRSLVEFEDREEFFFEALDILSLTSEEIMKIAKFRESDDDFKLNRDKIKFNVKARNHVAEMRFDSRFFFESIDNLEIANMLSEKLNSLSVEDLLNSKIELEDDSKERITELRRKIKIDNDRIEEEMELEIKDKLEIRSKHRLREDD